jgi:hypothetical protein
VVAEPGEEEQWIGCLTACLEVNQNRFAAIADQNIVGTKISMGKPETMKLPNNIHDSKKNPFIDGFSAAQGCPLDPLHGKAAAG